MLNVNCSEGSGSQVNRFWTLLLPFMSQTFLGFKGRFKLKSSKLLPSLERDQERKKKEGNETKKKKETAFDNKMLL